MKYIFLLALLCVFSCGELSKEGSSSIYKGFPLWVSKNVPFIVAVDDSGTVWQWSKDDLGRPINRKEVDVKKPVYAGIQNNSILRSGWALTADGILHTWPFENPQSVTKQEFEKPIKKYDTAGDHIVVLFEDGTVMSSLFNTGYLADNPNKYGNASLEKIKDIAAGSEFLLACTNEGKIKLLTSNNSSFGNAEERLENIERVGVYYGDIKGYKLKQDRCYAIDNLGYLFYFNKRSQYDGIVKTDKPSTFYFNNITVTNDGQLVEIGKERLESYDLQLPDSCYYFTIIPTKKDFTTRRYIIRHDGTLEHQEILYQRDKKTLDWTYVEVERKEVPDIKLATRMFN